VSVKVKHTLKKPEELTIVIVGYDNSVRTTFMKRGFKIATVAALHTPDKYDGIVFTGGADISPYLYGEGLHPSTTPDYARDLKELNVLRRVPLKKPKIGICRGAQLLNAFNGGTLVQDLDNHRTRHMAYDTWNGKDFMVSSLHHQMIVPHDDAWVMITASVSTRHSTYDKTVRHEKNENLDIEACFYPHTNSYCFQGHPEYETESADVFFDHLESVYSDVWASKVEEKKETSVPQVSVG
jgi:GMP synthase-like glutamine amidotransferase